MLGYLFETFVSFVLAGKACLVGAVSSVPLGRNIHAGCYILRAQQTSVIEDKKEHKTSKKDKRYTPELSLTHL